MRNAFRRHSSIHAGSFFFAEILRTMSSFRPGGSSSASTSVTKPYLYSRVASSSIASVDVDIICFAPAPRLRSGRPEPAEGRDSGIGIRLHAVNERPQPHVLFAFGLLKMKPR